MAKLRIGTCSWKYDSWKNIVYSPNVGRNYLKEYCEKFNTVEIDQWFWSLGKTGIKLPAPKTVNEYSKSVNGDFTFSIKMPNSLTLTHHYKRKKEDPLEANDYFLSNELLNDFLQSIEPLNPNLGPLMFQFEYLNKQKMNDRHTFMALFNDFIKNAPANYQYAIEIRNPNYLTNDYFDFLKGNNISHVFLHGYYMPSAFEVYEKFKSKLKSPVIFRLHGPDRTGIEEMTNEIWNSIAIPRDKELDALARIIAELLSKEIDVYVNVNNHYEGSAPLTIERIKERLINI